MSYCGAQSLPRTRRLCGLLVIASLALAGCQGEREESVRLQKAREALQSQLSTLQRSDDGSPFHRYLIEHVEDGLRKLENLPDGELARPMLLFAVMNAPSSTENGEQWRLGFDWAEHEFSVTGFYLVDKDGKVAEFPAVLPWANGERDFFKNTAWRETWFPVINDVSDKGWENETVGGKPVRKPIVLNVSDFSSNEMQLGLMTKAGREPSTVAVAINAPSESPDMAPAKTRADEKHEIAD